MTKKHSGLVLKNDFAEIEWTLEHEAAFVLMRDTAAQLLMTPGELMSELWGSTRVCPCCEAEARKEEVRQRTKRMMN